MRAPDPLRVLAPLCAERIASDPGRNTMAIPKLLAMLHRQDIEGDTALLRLAQERFFEAGLGGEFYPGNPDHLHSLIAFRPRGLPCTVHLPRSLDAAQPGDVDPIIEFARVAAGQALGMVIHDSRKYEESPNEALRALLEIDGRLGELAQPPMLFVEYAAGLGPDFYAAFIEKCSPLRRISACIDVSHVGIRACQIAYARKFNGVDICALRHSPELPNYIEDIECAVTEARPVVISLIKRLSRLDKPLHFHLHDGHPLSTLSRYGVSDHLSFLQEIRLPSVWRGRLLTEGIFGIFGLDEIVHAATDGGASAVSMTLEIHPQDGRTPLGAHAHLFSHWKDMRNAERMNYWVDTLQANAALIRHAFACGCCSPACS